MSTGIRNGNFFCFNCGGEFILNLPMDVKTFIKKQKAFDILHKNCKPTWKQPEVDQNKSIEEKMQFWLKEGERGASSETMFTVLAGENSWCRPQHRFDHPHDPDDFRRCYLLLKTIPEWKADLYKLKDLSEVWTNLVENWDKLTIMIEEQMKTHKRNGMYEFMKSLGC